MAPCPSESYEWLLLCQERRVHHIMEYVDIWIASGIKMTRRGHMNLNYMKAFVTTVMSLVASMLGVLYIPVLLMVACNVIDYVTGIWAAGYRQDGGVSSYCSMCGIIKKVTMWLLVFVGAIIDQLLAYAAQTIGYQLPSTFLVACVVAIWIICNELISILENMIDIGIELPAFLLPLVRKLKTTVDKMGGTDQEE